MNTFAQASLVRKFCFTLSISVLVVVLGRVIAFSPFGVHDHVIEAARNGDLRQVRRLARYDLALSRTGFEEHLTPMGAATQSNRIDVVHFLLSKKVDVHSKDDHGNTALALARRYHRPDVARLLIRAGAHR